MKGYIVMLLPVADGPNAAALGTWLDFNMPELAADLDGMPYANKRARLNALTGAQVRSCDTIEDGSARFLAALQDLAGERAELRSSDHVDAP